MAIGAVMIFAGGALTGLINFNSGPGVRHVFFGGLVLAGLILMTSARSIYDTGAARLTKASPGAAHALATRAREPVIWAAAPALAPAPSGASTAAAGAADPLAQLTQLGKLRDAGVLTEEEFAAKKAELLRRI